MRRRLRSARDLTAAEIVALAERIPGRGAVYGSAAAGHWRAGLAEHGLSPLDYFRARFALRRGLR